ncbi:MAG: peptidylprolyl isomerase [Thermocrispum sp.]
MRFSAPRDLGALSADQLEKEYAKAAFETGEGELFGPVKTQHGWNVGRVTKIIPGEPAKFDAVKDDLNERASRSLPGRVAVLAGQAHRRCRRPLRRRLP